MVLFLFSVSSEKHQSHDLVGCHATGINSSPRSVVMLYVVFAHHYNTSSKNSFEWNLSLSLITQNINITGFFKVISSCNLSSSSSMPFF